MNKEILFKDETFLENSTGNFLDCIYDSVDNMQRYADTIPCNIHKVYKSIKEVDNIQIKKLLKFVVIENENIIKMRGCKFAIEMLKLINRKYNTLCNQITENGDEDIIFKISEYGCMLVDKEINNIEWRSLSQPLYISAQEINDCKFKEYAKLEFEKYSNEHIKTSNTEYNIEEFMIILNTLFTGMGTVMFRLKRKLENSDSIYTTSTIVKIIISMIILLYGVYSSIKIEMK